MNPMDLPNFMRLTSARHRDNLRRPAPRSAGGRARGAAPDTHALVSPPWPGDPTIAALMKLVSRERAAIRASQSEELEGAAVDWSAEEVDELTDRLDESVRDRRRLSAQLDRANNELQRLRDRNQRLADALGACSSCWGEDSGCPDCQGCGRPGRSMPDERLFEGIVMPAVRLLRPGDPRPSQPMLEPAPSRTPRDNAVVNLYANALLDRGTCSRQR